MNDEATLQQYVIDNLQSIVGSSYMWYHLHDQEYSVYDENGARHVGDLVFKSSMSESYLFIETKVMHSGTGNTAQTQRTHGRSGARTQVQKFAKLFVNALENEVAHVNAFTVAAKVKNGTVSGIEVMEFTVNVPKQRNTERQERGFPPQQQQQQQEAQGGMGWGQLLTATAVIGGGLFALAQHNQQRGN